MTNELTIEQATEIAKSELEKVFKMPFSKMVKLVKQNAKVQYGAKYGEYVANRQVKLFYTGNDNFAGGRRNGYGVGVYLAMTAINGRRDILIAR